MLFEFSIDLESELIRLLGFFEIVVPSPIVDELKFLSKKGKGKQKIISKPALELTKNYKIVKTEGKGDEAVLLLAKKLNAMVLTNDKELRNRVKQLGLHNIFLRGKSKLEID